MKIAVYAAAKDEVENIDAWYESCRDADTICVVDTGSTDGSLEKLINLPKIKLSTTEIIPWRFDDAFNISMYSIPSDHVVCVRLDLDERLQPGWRNVLENLWTKETTRLRYPYVWNWNTDGTPGRQWYGDRIHSRANYRWVGPTHEYLMCRGKENIIWTDDLKIYQYPKNKEKNDLPLLIEFVNEYPHDHRALAYLGRELYYRQDFKHAISVLKKHIEVSNNKEEKAQSFWLLAECDMINALEYLTSAKEELPNFREPLVKLSEYYYLKKQWPETLKYAVQALDITNHPMSYICEESSWSWKPYDLAAISSWNLGKYDDALKYGTQAAIKNPNDTRLQENLKYYQAMVKQ